jgi:hypothetical protein
MPLSAEEIAAVVRSQSTLLGLPITDSQRPGVEAYLTLAAGMAEPVLRLAAQLDVHDESGSIFQPVVPREATTGNGTSAAKGDAGGGE